MDLFMMRNVLVIVEAFTMYAKRSLRRLPAKHRLTDIGKIPAHAAQPDIWSSVSKMSGLFRTLIRKYGGK